MMSLLSRIKDVIAADLHRLLDEKEKKNPTAMLNQFVRKCEGEIRKVEGLIKRQGELKSKFFEEKEHASYMVKKREYQVELAMKAGEEDLEKRAQADVIHYKEQAQKLTDSYEKAKKEQHDLQTKLQEMREKLKEIHQRRLELMNPETMTHTSKRADTSTDAPTSYFAKVEKQMDRIEELMNQPEYDDTSFDARMAQLEKEAEAKLKEAQPDAINEEKE